jgi:hypothetical protein
VSGSGQRPVPGGGHDPGMTTDAPLGAAQLGLFATEPMDIDRTFATAHRIDLDPTSWVEHVPGWLTGSEHLLAALVAMPGWDQRSRWMINRTVLEPRLTAEFPDVAGAPVPMLRTAAAASG